MYCSAAHSEWMSSGFGIASGKEGCPRMHPSISGKWSLLSGSAAVEPLHHVSEAEPGWPFARLSKVSGMIGYPKRRVLPQGGVVTFVTMKRGDEAMK